MTDKNYVTYKDLILEEVEPMVERYIIDNPDGFKGEPGEPGDTVVNPPKMYTRAEYDALNDYDDNTLYIVKEA